MTIWSTNPLASPADRLEERLIGPVRRRVARCCSCPAWHACRGEQAVALPGPEEYDRYVWFCPWRLMPMLVTMELPLEGGAPARLSHQEVQRLSFHRWRLWRAEGYSGVAPERAIAARRDADASC